MQVSSALRMGMLEQTAVSGSENSVREEVVSRMVRYQAAKQVRGSYYAIHVRGYAVLTGVDIRCHARGHPEPSNKALSPNRRWTRRRTSA